MNARDTTQPAGGMRARLIASLSRNGMQTLDDLMTALDEPRKRIYDNVQAAITNKLISRERDDVTGQPAYKLTPTGVALAKANVPAETTDITPAVKVGIQDEDVPKETIPGLEDALNNRQMDMTGAVELLKSMFHGLDVSTLPDVLISAVAKLYPGSGGMYWEQAVPRIPERIQETLDLMTKQDAEIARLTTENTALVSRINVRDADIANITAARDSDKRMFQHAISAMASISDALGVDPEADTDDIQAAIEDKNGRLFRAAQALDCWQSVAARHACETPADLEGYIERLAEERADANKRFVATAAPTGYVIHRPVKPLMRFTKAEAAQNRALSFARTGVKAQVFALVPVGVAVPGAEWRDA